MIRLQVGVNKFSEAKRVASALNSIILSFHWSSPLNLLRTAAQVVQLSHLRARHGRMPWRAWPSSQRLHRGGDAEIQPKPPRFVGSSPFTIFTSQSCKALRDFSYSLGCYVVFGPMAIMRFRLILKGRVTFCRRCDLNILINPEEGEKSQNKTCRNIRMRVCMILYASAIHGLAPMFHTPGDRLASALAAASPPLDCATCGASMAPI